MNRWKRNKTKSRKTTAFKTSRSEIDQAVSDYLRNGGKITKLKADDSNYDSFLKSGNSSFMVDEFLSGQ